jgi:hypothetical protein
MEMLKWMESGAAQPTLLTFVAEHVGKHCGIPEAKAVLVRLLSHPKPYVQEGAIYGLAYHLDDADVIQALTTYRDNESHLTSLRELAASYIP